MKKIGFIDYYLSEWHADNYPKWIDNYAKETGLDYKVTHAYGEIEVSPVDGLTTDEWCEKLQIKRANSIKELVDSVDYVVLLAPTNPETHLALCAETFKYLNGKSIYVDKTFAPDYKTALEIFKVAKEYNVKFFSTSALRYSPILVDAMKEKNVITYMGGSNIDEYIIHQVESIVKFYGVGATKVKAEQDGDVVKFEVAYENGKIAYMNYSRAFGYDAEIEKLDGTKEKVDLSAGCFQGLINNIVDFFETGKVDFDNAEILEVMKIRDASLIAKDNLGQWIEVQKN
ncbi:MAG: hypothetical protein IKV61_02845 [Clostridia bacterium]|nr:hypothetical protein [Clostridia bacterium]